MTFTLPDLQYSYSDLEPHIDARTMEIHHSKHHAGYTNNLNNAITGTAFENKSIKEICATQGLSGATRNNGGGFYNHCLFWDILTPNPAAISNEFSSVINRDFGSMEGMKKEFSDAASSRFGSGWAWLCVKNNHLSICSTANQDNPIMDGQCGGEPILCLDVWEHAYYLNYQNKRPDYIASFWNIVNWQAVESKYQSALK